MSRLLTIPSARRRRPSWAVVAGLFLLGASWLQSVPATAQDGGRGSVEAAIAATDRRIEQAQELLSEHPDERGAAELSLAVDLQARAKAALAADELLLAGRLTRDARLRADRVIALVRGLPAPDRVEFQLERTRQVLERAREQLQGCEEPRARALLRVAVEMQARAEASYRESRYLAALQLTMSSRERGEKALRMCQAEESLQEAASRALRQTDDLLPRAREVVSASGSEPAALLLARAESGQASARREYEADRFASSLRMTQSARLQAQRAMRLASRAGSRDR